MAFQPSFLCPVTLPNMHFTQPRSLILFGLAPKRAVRLEMLQAVIDILEIQLVCGLITFSRAKSLQGWGCVGVRLMMGKQLLLGELNLSGKEDVNCACMSVSVGQSLFR